MTGKRTTSLVKAPSPALAKPTTYKRLLTDVINLVETGRTAAGRAINQTITTTYWQVGQQIVEHEQGGSHRAGYGQELITKLSLSLTKRFGKGFSQRNLDQMRLFYLTFPIPQTPSAEFTSPRPAPIPQTLSAQFTPAPFPLPWSHYVRLLSVRDAAARAYYESEAITGGWSERQLDRQISTLAYHRTRRKTKKLPGEPTTAEEIIRNPFVLEFLALKDEYSESELEAALTGDLQQFLLELGNDFTFVARQKRLRVGDEWFTVDLLFYNRRLRCLVIIDLKIGRYSHADAGQMNLYLNYAMEHWTNPGENPPIGLILCSSKDNALVHYSLNNLPNKILAEEYQLALPSERDLKARLKRVHRNLVSPVTESPVPTPRGKQRPKKS